MHQVTHFLKLTLSFAVISLVLTQVSGFKTNQ